MRRSFPFLLLGLVLLTLGSVAYSGDAAKGYGAKMTKSRYLVIWAHTPEQCLASLDEINAKGAKALAVWDFGCKADDHTAYQIVTAASEEEVKSMLPASGRDMAKVVKLSKFTAADIKTFHEQMSKQ